MRKFLILISLVATNFCIFSTVSAETGVEKYEAQPEGRLEDVQLTGAMVTSVITKSLQVNTGVGRPSLKSIIVNDAPVGAKGVFSEKGRLALLLIDGERIIYEDYRAPASGDTLNMGLSISKTLTSVAVGQAFCDGKIRDLSDRAKVYIPEFEGLSYGEATIEELLLMRAGGQKISAVGNGQARSGMFRALLFHKEAVRDQLVESGKGGEAPGRSFNYDNMSTQALVSVVERVSGVNYLEFLSSRVLASIEFEKLPAFFIDKEGVVIAGGGMHASTRDWGRVGLLLNKFWTGGGGECLEKYMKRGFSSRDGSGYGYHVWMHKEMGDRKIARMAGALGQHIYFTNFNSKVLVAFSNGSPRKALDQLVETWMVQ